jgi:transketolase
MRFAAVETIYKAALKNKNIYFLTADLNHVMEKEFKENIPNQYLNVGIAEQNMVGVAAGLALAGKKVFIYSITPFVTMRPYEQVKIDVASQNLDVTLIGVGCGFAYGIYGNTHCSIEDIAVMRCLPNMKVICPANPMETTQLMNQLINLGGPSYIRIGRGKEPNPDHKYNVIVGKSQIIKKGSDITIIATGTILDEAIKAASLLEKICSVEVVNIHTIKPLDEKFILNRIQNKRAVFTLEEHSIIGGLGSAISQLIAEKSVKRIIFKSFAVNDKYLPVIGDQDFLRNQHHISADYITKVILKFIDQLSKSND